MDSREGFGRSIQVAVPARLPVVKRVTEKATIAIYNSKRAFLRTIAQRGVERADVASTWREWLWRLQRHRREHPFLLSRTHSFGMSTEDSANASEVDESRRAKSNLSALLVLATFGAVMFGQYAQDVAVWLVCAHSDLIKGQQCKTSAIAEALMIGTLVSTMVAVFGAAFAGHLRKETPRHVYLTVLAALGGAFLALLKASSQESKYPNPDLLGRPLYVYVVCIILFAIPLVLTPQGSGRPPRLLAINLRISAALLIGAVIGYVAQGAVELLWKGFGPGWGAQKFVAAPSAIVIATGAWGVAMLDPWLRPNEWSHEPSRRRIWLGTFFVGAVILAAGYGGLFYYYDGTVKREWLQRVGISQIETVVFYACLLLPGLLALGLATSSSRPLISTRSVLTSAVIGSALAGAMAWWVFLIRTRDPYSNIATEDGYWFVAAQMFAAIGVVATVIVTHKALEWLHGRRDWAKPTAAPR